MSESRAPDPSVLVLTPRPRGRPRVSEPRVSVSTWIPATEHERLQRLAQASDQSISSLVKSLLMLRLPR